MGAKAPVGVGVTCGPWGRLIWLPGKPPCIADGESHREGSCPAMTDGETNGLWNSISCEIHSEGGAASTIIENHANTTVWVRPGSQKMGFSWLREPQITLMMDILDTILALCFSRSNFLSVSYMTKLPPLSLGSSHTLLTTSKSIRSYNPRLN